MKTLNVSLGERSYPIHIGKHLLDQSPLPQYIKGKQVMVVSNETIAPLYLDKVLAQLDSAFTVDHVVLPDGESYKTLEHLNWIFDALLENRHNRTTTLIALGGGVVGDMTGFAAACYQRGVDFIQVPTTLLSQVDSSVGGKTGVNHPAGKNMIGAFYQPNAVIIDTDVLTTLPARELSAGLAEVIKYGLIYDESFLCWLEENMSALRECDQELLAHAIYRACEIKAEVVEQDELERGIRAWLNLGHTFGHAIETHQGYGTWLHGEAVGTGMLLAAQMSHTLGWISEEDVARTKKVIAAANLPIHIPFDMSEQDFISLMAVDKKVLTGSIRLVLLEQIGKATVTEDFSAEQLTQVLASAERG